jgi:hypothetical protein
LSSPDPAIGCILCFGVLFECLSSENLLYGLGSFGRDATNATARASIVDSL